MPDLACLRALWWGVLHAIGMFGVGNLTDEEIIDGAERRAYFSVGEVTMAAILAGSIAVPAGFWFATLTVLPLAVIGGAVLFLPLFIFLPRLIRYAMKADTDAVLDAFGKNGQVKKVFWTSSSPPPASCWRRCSTRQRLRRLSGCSRGSRREIVRKELIRNYPISEKKTGHWYPSHEATDGLYNLNATNIKYFFMKC